MSFRIKIPPNKPSSHTMEASHSDIPSKRRRTAPKRYQQGDAVSYEPVLNGPRTTNKPQRRKASVAYSEPSSNPDVDLDDIEHDMTIDIVNETSNEDEYEDEHDRVESREQHDDRYEHSVQRSTTSSQGLRSGSKTKMKSQTELISGRKKSRRMVVSESEEEYAEPTQDPIPEKDDDEEDYYSPDEKMSKSKGKGKAISAKGASKGTKRKAIVDPDDGPPSALDRKGPLKAPAMKKRLKPSLKLDDNPVDVVGDSLDTPEPTSATIEHPSPATTSKQESPAPTVIQKKKLPTIKKNKLPGTPATGAPSSTSTASKKPLLELGLPNKLNHDELRKTMIGKTDIDLSNKSIYQELFLKPGSGDGNTPRRAKEEERRKELNRMREDAKAKRAAEARRSFDLQAQYEKISLFEERLRAERSSALYPNFLAAKWRQTYERERFQQRNREQHLQSEREPEEGEVA